MGDVPALAVLEDGPRAAEIDAVSLFGVREQRGDGSHVDHRIGPVPPEDILGGALADVDRVQLDLRGRAGPAPRIDADHPMAGVEQAPRYVAREQPGDSGDGDLHRRPRSINCAMRSLTSAT